MKNLLSFSFFFFASLLSAQGDAPALLLKVDLQARGVPGYELNLIPHYYGLYSLPSGRVEVFVVRESLTPPKGSVPAKTMLSGEAFELYFEGSAIRIERAIDFTFLFRFALPAPPELSAFVPAFAARYRFFAQNARRESDISLPAVVEFR